MRRIVLIVHVVLAVATSAFAANSGGHDQAGTGGRERRDEERGETIM